MYVHVCMYVHTCMYVCTYIYVCTYMYVCMYIHVCMYVRTCMYVRIYVHHAYLCMHLPRMSMCRHLCNLENKVLSGTESVLLYCPDP